MECAKEITRRSSVIFPIDMEFVEGAGLQMETFFPAEIAAEKIHDFQILGAGPGDMMEVDDLGNAGKLSVGAPRKDRVLPVPDSACIHGGHLAANQERGDPEHILLGEPGEQADKGLEKTGIGKVGVLAVGCQIQIEQMLNISKIIIPVGNSGYLQPGLLAAEVLP